MGIVLAYLPLQRVPAWVDAKLDTILFVPLCQCNTETHMATLGPL